jgi:uncharacterized Zn finger protein
MEAHDQWLLICPECGEFNSEDDEVEADNSDGPIISCNGCGECFLAHEAESPTEA